MGSGLPRVLVVGALIILCLYIEEEREKRGFENIWGLSSMEIFLFKEAIIKITTFPKTCIIF